MISVFTPTLDRPGFLQRAAASLLAQTYDDWEWVVLDVGAVSIVDVLPQDERIRYSHRPPACGPAVDFQRAFELTRGEIVHPLGDDDALARTALEIVVSELKSPWLWLVGLTLLHDEEGNIWTARGGSRESFEQTMAGEYMLGGAVYWRRELSDLVGGFDPDFSGAADVDLYMRFGRASYPRIVPDALYLYTDHAGTDSHMNALRQATQVRRILSKS